ncbi:TetR/AcrR family transcriptional regulator [Streptomyces sp. NPDC059426]|uniref:TetR/AcrR family transcriptional regulator n=1 Tax=Streptomyces sp. NPDC059426 TaxID=3346827 RepID=UPI0036A646BE
MTAQAGTGRINQKQRTRTAIVAAARELIGTGAEVTMPLVARAALVSEATAYRYFPDLHSLISEALSGVWPPPAEALFTLMDLCGLDPQTAVDSAVRTATSLTQAAVRTIE